jgi:hypothetical protein
MALSICTSKSTVPLARADDRETARAGDPGRAWSTRAPTLPQRRFRRRVQACGCDDRPPDACSADQINPAPSLRPPGHDRRAPAGRWLQLPRVLLRSRSRQPWTISDRRRPAAGLGWLRFAGRSPRIRGNQLLVERVIEGPHGLRTNLGYLSSPRLAVSGRAPRIVNHSGSSALPSGQSHEAVTLT